MLAPAGLLLATATPGVRISKKLFTSGTALLNQAAAKELDWAELAVLTDGDVFPQGTVAISGMKIARNQSMERVVASAAGVDMTPCRIIYKGGKMRLFGRVTVVFGPPIPAEKLALGEEHSARRLRECKALLEEHLERLLEENRQYL